jgi:tRNA dimethylallyltransferase
MLSFEPLSPGAGVTLPRRGFFHFRKRRPEFGPDPVTTSMPEHPFRNALVLTGPTGSGKTALALEVAERLGAEIVTMDSMTLYRGMDIGTAKPTRAEQQRVPHHLLDVLDPWESSSVAWWLARAAGCCRDFERRGRRVLLVGGTPLYLKAVLQGLFEGPPADEILRQRLLQEAEQAGALALHERLSGIDPVTAARLHPNDLRRVVRALEVWELTGRPISAWQQQWSRSTQTGSPLAHPVLWLDWPRAELYARIDARVRQMVASGWLDEARSLRGLPRPLSREATQALGYREVFDHLDARATLEETVARIQMHSRQFAKRQLTWFRHLPGCEPITGQLTEALLALTIQRWWR